MTTAGNPNLANAYTPMLLTEMMTSTTAPMSKIARSIKEELSRGTDNRPAMLEPTRNREISPKLYLDDKSQKSAFVLVPKIEHAGQNENANINEDLDPRRMVNQHSASSERTSKVSKRR